MDDTQTSRVSDAAATRKRRSSILKSQRPPRTPFSELEFNVATPTDTAKSRRVSFSRRTGVAEFATNEATTTWKNFYEEHNRSIESVNDVSKQIGHIGKRIFDQQFEVVEADVDVLNPGNMNKSLSHNNFNHQLLSLDRTEELKLSGNHSIMNLSTFTNTNTNLFGEPALPRGEVTDRIDVNFSNIQLIGSDDLDDIENDLKQNFQGAFKRQNLSEYIQVDLDVTHAALLNDDMSITDTVHSPEVHVPINVGNSDENLKMGQSDDLDEIQRDLNKKYGREMSMSQSINSLKALDPKTKLIDGNYEVDKENIAVNPYAPLKETENFAVNEELDKVLVFDGKRLTLQADKAQDEPLPPKPIENAQRKTIVLNFNDDLPNFVDVPIAHTTGMIEVTQLKKNLVLEDMSITEPVLVTNKRSFIYDEDQGNITITQAVATNMFSEDKRRTIHYDDSEGNISMTQALPTKIAEKRRTIVYDDEEGEMSITRALPTNFLSTYDQNEKRETIVFNDGNMSITQAIPSYIIPEKDSSNIPSNEAHKQKTEKCRTIFYEDNYCNFTMAQAIPSNYSIASKQSERRRTVVFEADTGNISVTQVVPSVIIQEKFKEAKNETVENKIIESQSEIVRRRTIVYDNDTGDLSITQSVPNHILKTNLVEGYESQKCLSTEGASNEVTNTANSDTNKRKTIVFDIDDADISMTQAVSLNQVLCAMRDENKVLTTKSEGASNEVTNIANSDNNKRKTIVFDNDDADISMTQAVALNQVLCATRNENKDQTTKSEGASNEVTNTANSDNDKRKTIVFDTDDADISITQAVSLNQVLCSMRDENKDQTTKSEGASNEVTNTANSDNNKRKTIVFDTDDADISMTQAVSLNQVLCSMRDENKDQTTKSEGASNEVTNTANSDNNKRKTIVFDNDDADISMTQAVSLNQVLCSMRDENKEQTTKSEGASIEVTNTANSDNNKRKTIVFDNDDADISMTQAVSLNQVLCSMRDENKEQTTKSEGASIEVTNTANNDNNKRKSIVFDNDDADISMTQAVSLNQVLCATRDNKDQSTNFVNENYPEPDLKKSFVRDVVHADISITQPVPTNVIKCFNLSINDKTNKTTNSNNCDKRRTVAFEDDEFDISMNQVVNTETIVQKPNECNGQDERNVREEFVLEAMHEALHNKKGKSHRTIVYEKEDENLSVSVDQQSEMELPYTSVKDNILRQRNTVFNYVSSSADSLAKMLTKIQNNDENKQSNNQDISEILNVPMMYTIYPENNENAETEKRFDMSSRNEIKKVIRKALSPEVQSDSSSGINFSSLTRIQNDLEKNLKNVMSKVMRENYKEAVVFQTDTHHASLLPVKSDSKSANFEATFINENLSSSSKAVNDDESKQIDKVSSEMQSNVMDNVESQNENKSPGKILIDNTSISQDTEKTSVRSIAILNNLLDMSSNVDDTSQDGEPKVEDNKKLGKNSSDEGRMFVITHDQKEINIQTETADDTPHLIIESPLPLEYKSNNKSLPLSQKIQKKLHNMKEVLVKSTNKTIDKIRTPILKGKSKEDRVKSAPIRRHLALENKYEEELEEEQSFVPKRQSIALCREDMFNNLSMAGAALKTQIDFDDEYLEDSPEHITKSVQISNDVVKTLQFDESVTETNLFEKLSSPLQKAAIGKTSYVNDYKSNVIPHFTTVSDGIKELMDDLVKPNSDNLPFDCSLANKATEKVSTHSTEIQANLVTSSQVELLGPASESISDLNMNRISSTDITSETSIDVINAAVDRSVTRSLRSPIKAFTSESSGKHSETERVRKNVGIMGITKRIESPSRVLIFDHYNPLNNILLSPEMLHEAHAYSPVQSKEGTVSACNSAQISVYEKRVESTENVTVQYNVSHVRHCMKQSGDSTFNRSKPLTELTSKLSLVSKPASIDRSTEIVNKKDRKSARINTLIAMKGNLELLEDDSSLTLVDDALAQSSYNLSIPSEPTSAMKVIYSSNNDDLLCDIDSELTSNEMIRKSKKRGRDTNKQSNDRRSVNGSSIHKQIELTPKPNKKVLKLSQSPNRMKPMQPLHGSENVSVESEQCNKKADVVLMQNLEVVTENKVKPINYVSIQESVTESISRSKSGVSSLDPSQTASQSRSDIDADSSEMESSCTSSNNLRDDMNRVDLNSSEVSKMDLQPDVLVNKMRDECGVNIVAVIENLPFMGRECEWESQADDMWSFRLLHGRIRLMMRLEHRYDARWRISPDTAVQHINVEKLQHNSKNMLGTVCIRFAADTMQWFVERGCGSVREVPALVRQCAAAARLAARWGRFMSEARHHLAYTLTPHGLVTLKVANIPLRCVWEVSLQLRLSRTGSVAPWVEASDVTVRRVMTCAPLRSNDDPAHLLRDLPRDWSHAPRAIWKIFKYLKHMTREEDDELFMA